MSYLSLNTWSIHRNLGPIRWTYWDEVNQKHAVHLDPQPETTTLLELPAILAANGFKAVEICHFHFPNTNPDYLRRLNDACQDVNILFHTLLLDYGDISSDDVGRTKADMKLIQDWIDIAAQAGAKRIRVIAGEASPDNTEALNRSLENLTSLASYAKQRGVRIVSENFKLLTSTAANCIEIVRRGNGEIGMIADFGNFSKTTKTKDLALLLPYCESVHVKPEFDSNGCPDKEEFRKHLNLLRTTRYNGPLTLIYEGPGDMWEGVERVRKIAEEYL
ncbi:sugar phosphate isomerase/epimerase family protein [Paenibacillus guangzhouensis]|uniref:sugar phosphate isomerase/epimerase family protein n=1 Tax=Paenibacillus guangzhouensis TaxID=1473112 RepID=UPI001266C564|nr:TIM barrel protein [Paenibacillus guangzhouensis]